MAKQNGTKSKAKPAAKSAAGKATPAKRQSRRTTASKPANGKKVKLPKSKRNVSQTIQNGTFVVSDDLSFFGTDGKSTKVRMGTVVDSNKNNEVAIVKYTTSKRHGRAFSNNKGFVAHGDKIYTLDDEGNPIKLGEGKFHRDKKSRDISPKEANEIKRRNIQESPYKNGNRANLRNLKGRKKEKIKERVKPVHRSSEMVEAQCFPSVVLLYVIEIEKSIDFAKKV